MDFRFSISDFGGQVGNPQSTIHNPPTVRLVVDELVLRGFPPEGRHRVADALAEELRALPWSGVRPTGGLPPLELRLVEGDGPERVGRELARALHRALVPGGPS